MKTAISLPDDLFERADAVARHAGISRSQLYRDALSEYLDRREPDAITQALDDVAAEVGPGADEWAAEAGRRTLRRSEW